MEDIQEEGMAGGSLLGTSIGCMDPIVPIAVSAPFSSASGPDSSAFPSSAASSPSQVEKSRVSWKKGKVSESASVVAAGGEEVVGGAVEEEPMEKTTVSASGGAGGLVPECSVESGGLRADAEPQNLNIAVLESATTPHFFTEFLKIAEVPNSLSPHPLPHSSSPLPPPPLPREQNAAL